MDGKVKAIVAHITLIGWIIALVLNSNEKDEFAGFYIKQTLGLMLFGIAISIIPIINIIGWLVVFVLWLISLIGAIQGEKKETPYIGKYFQEWFKGI